MRRIQTARAWPRLCALPMAAFIMTVSLPATPVDAGPPASSVKATGSVEVEWMGGRGTGSPEIDRQAFAEFELFPAVVRKPAQGEFRWTVVNPDGTVHRSIVAKVTDDPRTGVVVDGPQAWFVGIVVADEKFGMHDGDGGGGDGHDDGCTHDDGTTHDDGGCTHDDGTTHDDSGCTHDDGTTHDDSGCSGSGGLADAGGHLSGKESRVGQVLVLKMKDLGTPGVDGDHITWKWMPSDSPVSIGSIGSWPHLCRKTILAGNLTVIDMTRPAEPAPDEPEEQTTSNRTGASAPA